MAVFEIWYGEAKPMRAVGVNQCRLLRFAEKYQGWCSFTRDKATSRAVVALAEKDYLEINDNQFKFKYPSKG